MGRCKQPTQWEEEKNNVSCDLLPALPAHALGPGSQGALGQTPLLWDILGCVLVRNGGDFMYV